MLVQFESYVYREEKYRGEVELPLSIEAEVTITKDGYATGDSPTLYEVELLSATIQDSRSIFDGDDIVKYLDPSEIEEIEEEAIKEVQ
jgi:hypothetical protein